MSERRLPDNSYSSAVNQVGSTGSQRSTNFYQQQRTSFSALPQVDESWRPQPRGGSSSNVYSTDQMSFVDHGRLSDPVQRSETAHNLSITDTDKLQQRGHENLTGGYRGDGYRGDRIPSRYSFDETFVPSPQRVGQNSGAYPVERLPNFQSCFHGDTSSTSAASSGRSAWSDSSRSQTQVSHVSFS